MYAAYFTGIEERFLMKIGVYGFGVVGRSVLQFLHRFYPQKELFVWDDRTISDDEKKIIDSCGAVLEKSCETFLEKNDKIVVSPGVDIALHKKYRHKFLCELDFFHDFISSMEGDTFQTFKTIGVTGTLGKTSVASLLGSLFACVGDLCDGEKSVFVAGNIGKPMLDLCCDGIKNGIVVLELSSFQLELNKRFAPDIGIWTNFYHNHLDRHISAKNYFFSKWNLFAHQKMGQKALLPIDLCFGETQQWFFDCLKNYEGDCLFFTDKPFIKTRFLKKYKQYLANKKLFFVEDEVFCCGRMSFLNNPTGEITIFDKKKIFDFSEQDSFSGMVSNSFLENWIIVLAALHTWKVMPSWEVIPLFGIDDIKKNMGGTQRDGYLGEHRLEKFLTVDGVDFYNDSKATVVEATKAAVKKLSRENRPIILVLGGLDKGVDRKPLVDFLSGVKNVKRVFCLGDGCESFLCYERYPSLRLLVDAIMQTVFDGEENDAIVLFSPSGSSFDLFKNYVERGKKFKKEVINFCREKNLVSGGDVIVIEGDQ